VLGWPLQPTHNNFNLALNIALGIQLSAQIQSDKLVTFQERMSAESCSDTIVLKLPCLPTGPTPDMYYQYTFTYAVVWEKDGFTLVFTVPLCERLRFSSFYYSFFVSFRPVNVHVCWGEKAGIGSGFFCFFIFVSFVFRFFSSFFSSGLMIVENMRLIYSVPCVTFTALLTMNTPVSIGFLFCFVLGDFFFKF
jgi:hypothetical protein